MEPATKPRSYGATAASARAGSEMPVSPVPGVRGEVDVTRTTRCLPVIIILLMLIIDGLGFAVALAPQTRLFEDIVCRQYYSRNADSLDSGPHEDSCKIPAVQDFVAQLFGWQTFFDGIPGLVLAMYFGVLADTRGRRAVLFWSMAGQLLGMSWVLMICWLELPLQLTWFSSLFLIIGGGSTVTSAVSMMVLTDSTSEEDRSRCFFLAQAVLIVSEIIGPTLSSATMKKNLWLPLSIALALTATTTILAGVIPETLPPSSDDKPLDPDCVPKSGHGEGGLRGRLCIIWRHTSSTLGFIISHSSILYLVITFLVVDHGQRHHAVMLVRVPHMSLVDYSRQSLGILLQYISLRYSISISKANLLLSFKAFAQLATFALILPAADAFVVKHLRVSAKNKDLWLSRLSIGLLAIGFAVLVLAPSLPLVAVALVIYTLGSGFNAFARSLLSSLVEPHMIGTLFTTLAIMDTTGSLLAGPMVAGTFSWSLQLTGVARGLPFMFSFVICSFAMLALARVGVAHSTPGQTITSMEDEECRPMMEGEPEEDFPKPLAETSKPSANCL